MLNYSAILTLTILEKRNNTAGTNWSINCHVPVVYSPDFFSNVVVDERTLFNKFINGKGKRYNPVSNKLFRSKCEEDVKGFRIQSQAFICCRRRLRIEGGNITYNASRGACRLNLHSSRSKSLCAPDVYNTESYK